MSEWKTIDTAPMDGTVILVNDTSGLTRWCAARFLESAEWSGWVYDDELSTDSNPLGPNPTYWISIPPLPEHP